MLLCGSKSRHTSAGTLLHFFNAFLDLLAVNGRVLSVHADALGFGEFFFVALNSVFSFDYFGRDIDHVAVTAEAVAVRGDGGGGGHGKCGASAVAEFWSWGDTVAARMGGEESGLIDGLLMAVGCPGGGNGGTALAAALLAFGFVFTVSLVSFHGGLGGGVFLEGGDLGHVQTFYGGGALVGNVADNVCDRVGLFADVTVGYIGPRHLGEALVGGRGGEANIVAGFFTIDAAGHYDAGS